MLEGVEAWALALFAAFFIGVAKAGFSGTSLLSVAIFTHLLGARDQAGFALPLLIIADLCVYPAFRHHGSWKEVWRLLPAALAGVAVGWWLLGHVPEPVARRIIGVSILVMLALQALRVLRPKLLEAIAGHHAFGTGAGVAAGVTTMLANAAGPVFQLYLLSRRVPKMELIGIGARFFLLINLIKVPLNQIWHDLRQISQNNLDFPGVTWVTSRRAGIPGSSGHAVCMAFHKNHSFTTFHSSPTLFQSWLENASSCLGRALKRNLRFITVYRGWWIGDLPCSRRTRSSSARSCGCMRNFDSSCRSLHDSPFGLRLRPRP